MNGDITFESTLDLIKEFAHGLTIGNRWYKVNLHVHAKDMAPEKLIDEALGSGVDFISVTDHQTFQWVAGVLKAAAGRITVAPGMEITAHEGVHLLAIFPPAYSAERQTKFLGFLELSGTGDTNEASRKKVAEIFKKVDEEGGLIVIPHPFATKTGLLDSSRKISTKTEWLESGFIRLIQSPDDKIRYVAWDASGHWVNRYVLASAAPEQIESSTYCFAPINTSDCYDAKELGDGCTWFRMSEMSIEGLKQVACEPAARISKLPPPEDDHSAILAVRVIGGFCDQQVFLFNTGLNCVVGPNHAGKSAVFDFVRFALGMDEAGSIDARLTLLARLNAILRPEGAVELVFRHEGERYLIKRIFRPEVVIAPGEISKVTRAKEAARWFRFDQETETLQPIEAFPFPVEVYEQGRIHRLRDDIPRQLEMLDEFAGLQHLRSEQEQLIRQLNSSVEEIEPLRARIARLTIELAELPALRAELQEKEKLIPNDEEQQLWSTAATVSSSIKAVVSAVLGLTDRIETPLTDSAWEDDGDPLWTLFHQNLPAIDNTTLINPALFDHWLKVLESALQEITRVRLRLIETAGALRGESDAIEVQWEELRQEHERSISRELVKAGVDSPQELLARVRELRDKLHKLESATIPLLAQLREELERKEGTRLELLNHLEETDRQVREARSAKAKELTEALGGQITVGLTPFGDRSAYRQLLHELYSQISSKEQRIKNIDAQLSLIADRVTPRELAHALIQRGQLKRLDGSTTELTDFCSITPNTQTVLCVIADNIGLLNRLQTAPTPDVLKISVKRQGEEIYADLSTGLSPGEQSAALLTLALQSRLIPLIIDQPEDELGYSYVVNLIVPKILQAKLRRQMLIITHNANIPVLGDADLVIKMQNMPNPAGGRRCIVARQGCFESSDITSTLLELEGGRRAFEFRQHRYSLSDRAGHST